MNDYPYEKAAARAPGVYFEEIAPTRDWEFRTGIPLMVGFAEWHDGPTAGRHGHSPDLERRKIVRTLTSWKESEQSIKAVDPGGFLDYALRGFFENGGCKCIVVLLSGIEKAPFKIEALKKLFEDGGLLESFPEVTEADLVCVPDIMRKDILESPDTAREIQEVVLEYCRRMGDRFAILDCGHIPGPETSGIMDLLQYAKDWREKLTNRALLKEGAVYYPWLRVKPLPHHRHSSAVPVPACGHLAGIYARSDARFGVHKAPANEIVEGALDLENRITDDEQIALNAAGINCLRSFPGRGIRVWGARTLSGESDWIYVNVRRSVLTLVRWCERNFDDLVFEPNGPQLWDRVRDRLGAYCSALFQKGALKGSSVDEAFFIKCDEETNPLEDREAGRMICKVGLAPVTPAEFVIVRINCSVAGITATI